MVHLSPKKLGAAAQATALVVLLAAALPTTPAEARAGGGFSFGSRGSRSFSMPSTTSTAPRYSQPFQQTEAPPVRPGMQPAQPRRFGFGTGLLAGLLGAGLFGAFTGAGFFGGIAALFGLVFKLLLVGGVIWLLLRLFRGRTAPVTAGGPMSFGTGSLAGGAAAMGAGAARNAPLAIVPADYQAFEQTLVAVQDGYSREDLDALSRLATPEMVRRLAADIEENRRRGQRNDMSQVKLRQGDLSESWTEGGTDYATVAMRFAAVDVMVDRQSGRIASGDPTRPVEAVELWTFRRDRHGGAWILSGIQQAG